MHYEDTQTTFKQRQQTPRASKKLVDQSPQNGRHHHPQQQRQQQQQSHSFRNLQPCDPYVSSTSRYQRCLTLDEIAKFGESRETWCCVEGQPEQAWRRPTRKHYVELYVDKVFNPCPPEPEDRCQWKVSVGTHPEMRHHFPGRRTDYDHLCVYNIAKRRDEL